MTELTEQRINRKSSIPKRLSENMAHQPQSTTEKLLQFYCNKLEQDAPYKAFIRGLPEHTLLNEIIEELANFGLTAINVQGMISRRDRRKLPLFLVDVKPQENYLIKEFNKCQGRTIKSTNWTNPLL